MVADAINCLPVDETISFENAACSFVNPLTVVAFLELAKNNKHNFVIHTVGASSLGRMMNRLFAENGIQVINIVRRKEQEELLAKEGVKIVLNQTDPDFDEKLREICDD